MSGARLVRWLLLALFLAGVWLLPSDSVSSGARTEPQSNAKTAATPAKAAARPPNIVFILADDLDLQLGSIDYMPNLKKLLGEEGLTLGDFFVTNSLCCPSRVTYLRGQYTHNHEVFTNRPPTGGFEKFLQIRGEESTAATWLRSAGYATALFGKYLNGYPLRGNPTHIPPGWSEWYSPSRGNAYFQFNYELNENGRLVAYGSAPEDYMMDVLAAKAVDFMRRAAGGEKPFFVFLAPYAPHRPMTPAPRHERLFPGLKAPRTASFNEADVSDRPTRIRRRPPLTEQQIAQMDAEYRKRAQSLQAVDETIARVVETLRAIGQLDNTYIIFTSDNGYHMGQHRLLPGKATAYEEDVRVPFLIRGPGVPAGEVVRGYLAGNIDIAPTLAELAGVKAPDFVDGRSLVPLLRRERPAVSEWRQAYLIEAYPAAPRLPRQRRLKRAVPPPSADDGVLEPADPSDAQLEPQATYAALRTSRHKYVLHSNGERELFDVVADPGELHNLADTADTELQRRLFAHFTKLRYCAGATCRTADTKPE